MSELMKICATILEKHACPLGLAETQATDYTEQSRPLPGSDSVGCFQEKWHKHRGVFSGTLARIFINRGIRM
jgi:hypothetical protein